MVEEFSDEVDVVYFGSWGRTRDTIPLLLCVLSTTVSCLFSGSITHPKALRIRNNGIESVVLRLRESAFFLKGSNRLVLAVEG